MTAPRIRVGSERVEIDVHDDPPDGALSWVSGTGWLGRLVRGGETLAWARVLPGPSGISWARRRDGANAIAPIRARDARNADDWSAVFARALADAGWLRRGTFALSSFDRRGLEHVSRDLYAWVPPVRGVSLTLDRPAAFVERYALNGSTALIPLRARSAPDASRVKAWRKYARAGTLPPLLAMWIAVLDVWVLVDGHDRLAAAQIENVVPEIVGLYAIGSSDAVWPPEARDRARADAMTSYARIFESEARLADATRVSANARLVDAWSDHRREHAATIARFDPSLGDRLRDELASLAIPDEVKLGLLRS